MADSAMEEIWTWKGISGVKKHISLVLLATFCAVWKERNKKTFKGVKDDYDKVKDRWSSPNFLVMGHPLYSLENFGNLINILVDM